MSQMPNQPGRRSRRYIDWREAAQMLAGGQTPAAAAKAVGISEDRLMRHFETSRHFLDLIMRAGESRRCLAQALQGAPMEQDTSG